MGKHEAAEGLSSFHKGKFRRDSVKITFDTKKKVKSNKIDKKK